VQKSKKTATIGELITAEWALVVCVCISCTQQSGRLKYNSRFAGPGVGVGEKVSKKMDTVRLTAK